MRKYAEKIAQVPVMFILSHGQYGHIYRLKEFEEFWMHKEDEVLLKGTFGFSGFKKMPKRMNYLAEGDEIDIGNRKIRVIHI